MSKKGKRKEKKKNLCPPLTFLDKSIYVLCIAFSFLGVLLFVIFFGDVQNMIAFSKPETVAFRSNASSLFTFPFLLFLEISALVFLIWGWGSKKPIFGSKKFKYGEYPFQADCVPFFSRKKRNLHQKPRQKKFVRQVTIIWCSVLLVFSCLIPFGLFGRDALYQDNRVEKINLINQTDATYTADDFAHLTVKTQRDFGGGASRTPYIVRRMTRDPRYRYGITIEMKDGESFSFSNRDFDWRGEDKADICLDKLLEIKALFALEDITIEGANDVDEVAAFLGFDEQQEAKLKQLFSE